MHGVDIKTQSKLFQFKMMKLFLPFQDSYRNFFVPFHDSYRNFFLPFHDSYRNFFVPFQDSYRNFFDSVKKVQPLLKRVLLLKLVGNALFLERSTKKKKASDVSKEEK